MSASAIDFGRLARELQGMDSQALMQRTVEWAVLVVPGAEAASLSLVRQRRHITSAAATAPLARQFDDLQQRVGQGPCLDAMYEHETVRVADLASQSRWPVLARRWQEAGARSALCVQLFVRGHDLGAINVLSSRVDAFDEAAEQWGLLIASHAAVALAGALRTEGLDRATETRTVIGQAQGILMERLKVTPEVAFEMLGRASQHTNRKLHLIAADLVDFGAIPTSETHTEEPRTSPR